MDVSSGSGKIAVDLDEVSAFPYSESFADEAVIIVEALPSFAQVFDGWEGSIVSRESTEYVVVDCNKLIIARFSTDWRLIGAFCGILILLVLFIVILINRKNKQLSFLRKRAAKR